MFPYVFSWQLRMLNVLFTYWLAFAHFFLKCLFSPFIHLLNGLVRLWASNFLSSLLVYPKFPLQCRALTLHPICPPSYYIPSYWAPVQKILACACILKLCFLLLSYCRSYIHVTMETGIRYQSLICGYPGFLVLFSPMNIWHLCQKLSGVLYGLTSFSFFEACTKLFVLLCLYSTVLNWVW